MTAVSYSAIASRYQSLPEKEDYVLLRYIWVDGNGMFLLPIVYDFSFFFLMKTSRQNNINYCTELC
jgi:hypothetical protein